MKGIPAIAVKQSLSISHLFTDFGVNNNSVMNLSEGKYVKFESAVDSGAAQSVAPSKGFFEGIPGKESEGQRRGQVYMAAAAEGDAISSW